jgi:non-ribosomal peptide synthetase component E (peptide arylation enzyme)
MTALIASRKPNLNLLIFTGEKTFKKEGEDYNFALVNSSMFHFYPCSFKFLNVTPVTFNFPLSCPKN